jgi:chromosome segregation ATPase
MFHIERAREELYTLGRETDSTSAIHVDPKERGFLKRLIAVTNNVVRESDKQLSESARPKDRLLLYVVLNGYLTATSKLLRRSGLSPEDVEAAELEAPSRRRGSKNHKNIAGSSGSSADSQQLRAALTDELRDEMRPVLEREIKEKLAHESQRLEREKKDLDRERQRLSALQVELANLQEQLDQQRREMDREHDRLGQKEAKNQRIEQQTAAQLEEIERLQGEQETLIARQEELEDSLLALGTEALLADPEKALEIIYKVAAQRADS